MEVSLFFPRETRQPAPHNASRAAIEEFAEDVAKRHGFHQAYEPSYRTDKLNSLVIELVRKIGGRIFSGDFPAPRCQPVDFSLIVFAKDDFVIAPFGNASWGKIAQTQAVTNASEIGHVFLHYPPLCKFARFEPVVMACPRHGHDEGSLQCDREARYFAEAFLFPRETFKAMMDFHQGSVIAIASEFGVTPELVAARAGRLGYIVGSKAA